jgi:glycosyltransferase involved in cell wall biosynthesis
MTRISIIIPAYNSEHCLRETLEHALAQTTPAHEIIVVDDGSTDRTPDIAHSFGTRIRYLRQSNLGPAHARNKAIHQATGDWIAFLDHDDLFHPEKLAKQTAVAEAHPELVVIYSGFTYLHQDGTRLESPGFPAQNLWPALRYRTPILPSTAIVRRSALLELNGFNTHPRYRRIEDWELWFRLIRRHSPAAFSCIPDSLLTYRVLAESESKNVLPLTANSLAMLDMLLLDGLSPFPRFLWKRRIKARFLYHLSRSLREAGHPRSWEFAIESTLQWPLFGTIVPFARYRVFAHMLYRRLLGFQFNFRYWWPVRRPLDASSE